MKERLGYDLRVERAIMEVRESEKCTEKIEEFVTSLAAFGRETKFLTKNQAKALGKIYKQIVNNGMYIKHDWWN